MSDEKELTYVLNGRKAWGSGSHEGEALRNMMMNWHGGIDSSESVDVIKCRGFNKLVQRGAMVEVHADEVVDEEELELDGSKLGEYDALLEELEIQGEEILVEAKEG